MRHTRDHEEADRLINLSHRLAGGGSRLRPCDHGVVVVDGFSRSQEPIRPPVIDEQLVAVGAKGVEIRAGCIHHAGELLGKDRILVIEIELPPIPVRPKTH